MLSNKDGLAAANTVLVTYRHVVRHAFNAHSSLRSMLLVPDKIFATWWVCKINYETEQDVELC